MFDFFMRNLNTNLYRNTNYKPNNLINLKNIQTHLKKKKRL